MSVRLYVGNLPKEPVEKSALEALFADASESINSTKVIKDRKTGKCRGFAFLTVKSDEQADELIEKYNGQSFMDSPLKIEKALPRSKDNSQENEKEKEAPKKAASSGRRSNKSRRSSSSSSSTSGGVQPDPRWADELEQLKKMLAAQSQ
ncbi:MAG: RNA recognition motif domain-containing protein [Chroococcales cyanobacterium]